MNQTGNETVRFINYATASYIGIFLSIGLIGNTLVLYIYGCRFKPSPFNIFIMFLAVMDFLFCLIDMPVEIANMTHPVEFHGCKAVVTLGTITAFATGQGLIAIAALRFNAVCRPLKRTISNQTARNLSILFFCTSVSISWPSAVILENGRRSVGDGLYVTNCLTSAQYEHTPYPLIYNGIQFLIFLGAFISITVLYSITGTRLWKRKKYGVSTCTRELSASNSSGELEGDTKAKTALANCVSTETIYSICTDGTQQPVSKNVTDNLKTFQAEIPADSKASTSINRGDQKKMSVNSGMGSKRSNKLTPVKMLIIMAAIFFLSYVPHLSLMIYINFGGPLELKPITESILGILIRSYFLGSVCNPILYGCYNRKFREELKCICKALRKRLGRYKIFSAQNIEIINVQATH